ncbi:MAG: sensor histidine kinase [Mycobacteriales bacterium]
MPLRRRISAGILGIAGVAVVLFAIPLAVTVAWLDRGHEYAELQSEATRVAALVPDNPVRAGRSSTVPPSTDHDTMLGIYTPRGDRAGGKGPGHSELAAAAGDGRVHRGPENGQLVAAVPVPSDRKVVAIVRAAVPRNTVSARIARAWIGMILLGLGVLAVAWLLARRQARRIARPLEDFTSAARALGDGNFAVEPGRSDILEADIAGTALRHTAGRLGDLVERERAFSADASHQLRTPLTGLLLGLESALSRDDADRDAALRDAVVRARKLQETIDDLLSLRRDGRDDIGSLYLDVALPQGAAEWMSRFSAGGRRLELRISRETPPVRASAAALRQIVDVLLGNALQHGRGTVTLSASDLGAAAAVEVTDEGDGVIGDPEAVFTRRGPQAQGHGIGLALARSLAEADGGRLILRRAAPRPTFALLLPLAEAVIAPPSVPPSGAQPPVS